jgi:transcriptional regulator with XRE-family HTH domain
MISTTQMRAARAMLNLSQSEVAESVGISTNSLSSIEGGHTHPRASHVEGIKLFYESRGVEFIAGDGVRRRTAQLIEYNGADGFRSFMDDVYETVKEQGGLICVHDVAPDNWVKWLGPEWNAAHTERMLKIKKKYQFQITIKANDQNFLGRHAEYRWLPEQSFNPQSFYAYGDKLALMLFEPERVTIRVIYSREFAAGFRSLFSLAWNNIPPIPGAEAGR